MLTNAAFDFVHRMGAQAAAQLTAMEEAVTASRDREAQLLEREARALQQHAEAKQQVAGLTVCLDELQRQAGDLVEGLQSAGGTTARCIAAVSNTARSIQSKQSQQVFCSNPASHAIDSI